MISIFYGTRPEYIKLIPLYNKMKEHNLEVELVRINQHTSLIADCHFDREIDVKQTKENRLNSIIISCLHEDTFRPSTKLVIIQGDTATAFGVALAAYNKKIKIAHIEAGLRTYDRNNPFPEETYRRAISLITDYHFCVTRIGLQILEKEKIQGKKFVTGNTCLDNIFHMKDKISYENKILITLHRRENLEIMGEWIAEIDRLAKKYTDHEFIFTVHPNLQGLQVLNEVKHIKLKKPLSHSETIDLLAKVKFVITDSGGIQEESSFLKKKSIVCRKATERQEGLGIFSVLCKNVTSLEKQLDFFIKNYQINKPCPYGEGNSCEQIINAIKEFYDR